MPRHELTRRLGLLVALSEGLKNHLENEGTLQKIILKRGGTLLMPGMDPSKAYFLYRGICKFCWKDENHDTGEDIFQFGVEGEILLLWSAFFLGLPNLDVHIIALEDVEIYAITKTQMDEIYTKYPEARELTDKLQKVLWDKWVQYVRILRVEPVLRPPLFSDLYPELRGRLTGNEIQSYLALSKSTYTNSRNLGDELKEKLKRILTNIGRKTGLW